MHEGLPDMPHLVHHREEAESEAETIQFLRHGQNLRDGTLLSDWYLEAKWSRPRIKTKL